MQAEALTNEQWKLFTDILVSTGGRKKGRAAKDDRIVLSAIVYRLNTGVPWRELPKSFGAWQTIYGRLRKWIQQGVWESIFRRLIAEGIVDDSLIPSGSIVLHAAK